MIRFFLVSLSLLAVCAKVSQGQYIDLISPGPPAVPSDYLHLNVTYADSPPIVEMLVGTLSPQAVLLVDNSVFVRRDAPWATAFVRGAVSFRDRRTISDPGQPILLNFAPELDAGFLGVDVAISARRLDNTSRNVRDVTISGPGAYTRSVTAHSVPEPAGAAVLAAGLLALRRRRTPG